SSRNLKPELILVPDRFSINKYDANVNDIGLVVRDGLSGKNIGVYRGGGMEYPIRIQYAESDRNTLHGFENYSITTAKGNVPLKVLCNVTSGEGDAYINRKNGQRLVTITANTVNGISLLKKQKIKELVNNLKLPAGYKIHYTSTQDKVYDGLSAMLIALGIAVILCYMILAGATESIFLPFIMLCIVPCGFAGVLWALYFNGQSVSIISLVAVLIITGIIGCSAVIIIDKIRSLQKSGLSRNESFYEAFKSKFQTIVMIHLAVVLSISPMVVNGSAVEIQFAVAVIGGIIASAFMILFVIPALFLRSKNTKGNYSGINSKF
ncbi:MAG: efflux RND transporter permease subunit, partial [Fibrobacter sp.]|nr:efflux RND transporter permease subunit [Fibrobacter sp.]